MTDIQGLIGSLQPEDLAVLQERGADHRLDRAPAEEGEPAIAKVLVDIIAKAREENANKAGFLKAAVTFEAVAAVLLAAAVGIVLLDG